jgi:polyisoprenoid-binding protein YceI
MSTWTIDPVHSSGELSLDYMGFSTYRTGFRSLEGSLEFDPARPTSASVNASIPVASVDVTNERLMSRLMDADLLGGKDHPTITLRSTRVEVVDPVHWKVTGDLTIHGVARPVLLDTQRHHIVCVSPDLGAVHGRLSLGGRGGSGRGRRLPPPFSSYRLAVARGDGLRVGKAVMVSSG